MGQHADDALEQSLAMEELYLDWLDSLGEDGAEFDEDLFDYGENHAV